MEPLPPERAEAILRQLHFGHLGLARGGDSYVLPLFYGYDGKHVYFHSHPGLKDDYIKGTKEACFLATTIESEDEWESVQVFGPLEKVSIQDEILAAMDALIVVPLPPEYGFSEQGEPLRSGRNMYFWKLTPTRITGVQSHRPPPEDDIALS